MNDSKFEEQGKITKDINAKYTAFVRDLILFRFKLIAPMGIVLHLAFYFIDRIAYPSYAHTFLKIRITAMSIVAFFIAISFIKKAKPYIVPILVIAGFQFVIPVALMAYLADGTSCRYYEGVNLLFLGMSIINPFILKPMLFFYLISIGMYEIGMLLGHGDFNSMNFLFANYFLSSTALFVFLLSKFYKDQHYNAFVRQEQLKLNEETLAALYNQADKLSKTDTLTDINNRRNFSDMMKKKMEACEIAKTTFYLVIFDVDYFKQINDTHGHTFGDQALVSVVQVVKNNIRSNDFIGRFGGDEFVICLDHPNKETLMNRLIRVRDGVKDLKLMHDGKIVPITTSIGAAKFIPGTGLTEAKLIEKADFELFNVKKTTRGEISVDQIKEMVDFHFEEQDKIKKNIDNRYRDYVNGLILFRFRLIMALAIIMHLAFFGLDLVSYPVYAFTFLKIRIIDSCILLGLILLSFSKGIKPHIVWLTDAGATVFIIGVGLMVLLANGSSSRYYEGANLVFIGVSIINPFYIAHLVGSFVLWIGYWEIVMLYGHAKFNLLNFSYANYFMGSTAVLVTIMTKLYKNQHYNAFVHQERLKLNEETLAALYNQADKLSKTDTLTEINNRRHFSDMMKKKMEACEITKTTFYLVIFDVDYFKEINDTHGHTFGDKTLIKVVEVVKKNSRPYDFIGRFGGDEFVVCLDIPNKEGLTNRLFKIRSGVQELGLQHEGKHVPISVSMGAAKFIPGTGLTEAKLIEKADFELFNVKKTTRGEISVDQ